MTVTLLCALFVSNSYSQPERNQSAGWQLPTPVSATKLSDKDSDDRNCRAYVLLVSFYLDTPLFNHDNALADVIADLPYDGIAIISQGGPYDNKPVISYYDQQMEAKLINLKNSNKQLWPWIFLNRAVEFVRDKPQKPEIEAKALEYFSRIESFDLYNHSGAWQDFKEIFRNALHAAKVMGSPGIVIDHETYGNDSANDIAHLSSIYHIPGDQVVEQLKKLGKEMGAIAAVEYPGAVLWFLGLPPAYASTKIAEGILEASKEAGVSIRVIEGGEETLGYVPENIAQFSSRVSSRANKFSRWTSSYPDSFFLAGTIAPSAEPALRDGWIKDRYAKSEINNYNDLKTYIDILFSQYRYLWIYAAKAAHFDPFNLEASANYNEVLRNSMNSLRRRCDAN